MQWLQNKKRKEKKEKKRVLQKNNSAGNPRKKAANQTVLVVFLPSLERKSTLLFLSLSRLFPPRGSKARFRSFGKQLTNGFFLTS
jgi:hypothetical protein